MARIAQYDQIRYFVGTRGFISHSLLETKFNLRYRESRVAVKMLQRDGVIGYEYNVVRGGYEVLAKTYKADMI